MEWWTGERWGEVEKEHGRGPRKNHFFSQGNRAGKGQTNNQKADLAEGGGVP